MTDTMTDRELLEAAARAAGLKLQPAGRTDGNFLVLMNEDGDYIWSPLTDDGDAFRLAVKLGIQIRQYPIYDTPRFAAYACEPKWDSDAQKNIGAEALVQYDGDQYAATRRAIVRAAAAISESKE